MKLTLLLTTILISSGIAVTAQTNTFPANGNVGIGTTAATAKITFNNVSDGSNLPDGITWYGPNPLDYGIYRTSGPWEAPYQQLKLNWETGIILNPGTMHGKSYVDIGGGGLRVSSGNTGIGTLNPEAKLNIVDVPQNAEGGSLIIGKTNSINLRMGVNTTYSWIQSHGSTPLRINELGNSTLLNLTAGNVGIGTANPTDKLAVNGNIRAREIKVEAANWPDYVFDQDYQLLGLQELDAYIKANKHLPEMPSAKEVEGNGMALGELVKLQQKKIEELSLHLIEQHKRMLQMEKQLNKVLKNNTAVKN